MRIIKLLLISALFTRCANVIPPEGGPRDTIPPVLIKSLPANNSKNFRGVKLELEFNEFIQVKNPKEEIIITPTMGKDVKYTTRKNILIIDPGRRLDSATTYNISFRESIQDLNEGNPVDNLKIAFSTGTVIDTLSVSGKLINLLEGKPLERFNVAIYQSDTFNLTKHQPLYISRTDKKGRFSITNLKAGTYSIYGWEDKNKNLKVETNTERFGTYSNKFTLPEKKDSIVIPVVKLDSRQLKLNNFRNISNYTIIRLNKAPVSYTITAKETIGTVISHFGSAKNEIITYPPLQYPDSTLIRFSAVDSLFNKVDTAFYIKQTKAKPIKEEFKLKALRAQYTSGTDEMKAILETSLPIRTIIWDSVALRTDSTTIGWLNSSDVQTDTANLRLKILHKIKIPDSLATKNLNLFIKKGIIISFFGDTLESQSIKILPRKTKDLANVVFTSTGKKENWYIEALDDKYQVMQTQPFTKITTLNNLDPGNTRFRFFHDINRNGKWDINNPLLNSAPEEIIFYKNEKGDTLIPLRSNWTVELSWDWIRLEPDR